MDWLDTAAQLAALGGAAVLQAAVNDGYQTGRTRIVGLLGRGDAERESAVEAALEGTAAAVGAAADAEERERVRAAHTRSWTAEFAEMLRGLEPAERDEVAAEVRALAEESGTAGRSGRPGVFQVFRGPAYFQNGDHNHQVFNIGTTE
ncbi:hypothetical protein [Streptomyces sp. NPDC013455]|uniref:hypothetical protein n=1 Tax=Streptomyces sp. NPDC013455 TaxID=3155605 RepID=UPI0033D4D8D3